MRPILRVWLFAVSVAVGLCMGVVLAFIINFWPLHGTLVWYVFGGAGAGAVVAIAMDYVLTQTRSRTA